MIRLLCSLKTRCDLNGIHEETAMWFFNLFMEKWTVSSLSGLLASKHKTRNRIRFAGKTGTVITYLLVVNNLLYTYAIDESMADTEKRKTMFTEPSINHLHNTLKSWCLKHSVEEMPTENNIWMKSSSKDYIILFKNHARFFGLKNIGKST